MTSLLTGHRATPSSVATSMARAGAAMVLAGYVIRPYVRNYADTIVVAELAHAHAVRWVVSSVVAVGGYVLVTLAVRSLGSSPWPARALGLGSVLLAVQLGTLAAATIGRDDPRSGPEAIRPWEGPLIGAVLLAFGFGWAAFARELLRRREPRVRGVVVVPLTVAVAGGLLVPTSVGEYVSAGAMTVLLWWVTRRADQAEA